VSLTEAEPLPLSRERREKVLAARRNELAGEIAVQLVEPLGNALADQYNQRLVEPVAGRPGYQDLLRPADPAAGANLRYTVPGDFVMWPLSVFARLTCSAVAGDRSLTLEYQDSDQQRYLVAGAPVTLAASQQQAFCWHPLAGDVAWPVDDAAIAPLPQQMLYPTSSLVIRLAGGDVGDQIDKARLSVYFYPTSNE
jgi:hypothetical protein